jgi:hypothetical protein
MAGTATTALTDLISAPASQAPKGLGREHSAPGAPHRRLFASTHPTHNPGVRGVLGHWPPPPCFCFAVDGQPGGASAMPAGEPTVTQTAAIPEVPWDAIFGLLSFASYSPLTAHAPSRGPSDSDGLTGIPVTGALSGEPGLRTGEEITSAVTLRPSLRLRWPLWRSGPACAS